MAPLGVALGLPACFYGYGTDTSVTPVTTTHFPPTDAVTVYYRPPAKDERCVPIALLEIDGRRFEETAQILPSLREQAMAVGADTLFSVTSGATARSQGELLSELDPKNKPTVYSAHVVTGLAARCDVRTTTVTKPPEGAYGYSFGESRATVAARCVAHGSAWTDSPPLCTGSYQSHEGTVAYTFCANGLCRVDAMGDLDPKLPHDLPLPKELTRLSGDLLRRYGLPTRESARVPAVCDGPRLLECVANAKAGYTYQWTWDSGESIWLELVAHAGRPAVRVVYDASRAQKPGAPAAVSALLPNTTPPS